jgi:hypothetical protein
MNRRTALTLMTMGLLSLAVAVPTGNAVAQENQQVSYKVPAANTAYTMQQNIDVGDVPGHIVRVFELRRTFPNNAPVINGVALKEEWYRGNVDITNGNGTAALYFVYVMENGDKFFARASAVNQAQSGKMIGTYVGHITGGTGKFATIKGTVHGGNKTDLAAGINEGQTDIEYSVGK